MSGFLILPAFPVIKWKKNLINYKLFAFYLFLFSHKWVLASTDYVEACSLGEQIGFNYLTIPLSLSCCIISSLPCGPHCVTSFGFVLSSIFLMSQGDPSPFFPSKIQFPMCYGSEFYARKKAIHGTSLHTFVNDWYPANVTRGKCIL